MTWFLVNNFSQTFELYYHPVKINGLSSCTQFRTIVDYYNKNKINLILKHKLDGNHSYLNFNANYDEKDFV